MARLPVLIAPRRARAAAALALLLAAAPLAAKVPPEQAAQLGNALTAVGAQPGANADGSIPPWSGGQVDAPECFTPRGRYCNPWPDDRPLVTVTAANLDKYRDQLSAGQRALFERHPDSWRMNVYPTRRSFANPPFVYEGSVRNAASGEIAEGGMTLAGVGIGVPFPIPKDGAEALWNHRLRYRGGSVQRWSVQFAVGTSGDFTRARLREDFKFPFFGLTGKPPDATRAVLAWFREPERIASSVILVREALDQPKEAFRAWAFAPGEKKVHRAPNYGYDNPAAGTDGLRTNDQDDVFSGPLDRYDFKLVGKRELLVPANAYVLHGVRYKDLLRKGHLNPDALRYELRRVWVVEATVKKGQAHLYRRRTLFLDEDGWQVRVADVYNGRGELWRLQEGHTVVAYDKPYEMPVCETVYDLASGRYLAQALNNEEAETTDLQFEDGHFDVSSAARLRHEKGN